jgi:hypothetical protein
MHGACSTDEGAKNCTQNFSLKKIKRRHHFEDLDVEGNMLLKGTLEKVG